MRRKYEKIAHKDMGSLRDGRSFAEVIVGYDGRPIPPPPPKLVKKPIILEDGSFWAEWIRIPPTLIGVTHSFEHLINLPLEIRLGRSSAYGTKYLGGLEIGIRFRNDHDVKEVLTNEKYWGKWFCELKPGNSYVDSPERFAWLKIVSLPLHMWSEGKFACIVGTRKTKINEEVVVDSNKKILRVGIVEVDFVWSPFPSGPGINDECDGKIGTPDMVNSNGMADLDSGEDEDGISETVVSPACDPTDRGLSSEELEEGEFRYDCNIKDGKEATRKGWQ
ncbi:unnamed protein product [Lactuca virosa]|uniref:DUF4283 domain-containing protein n=1 Tax=Lactuca virosa TaxID=75947 RepID=A0AAU9P752_9ASTR|nr:unnamed protein product [Lactuca virosa]